MITHFATLSASATYFYWDSTNPTSSPGFGTAAGSWAQNNTSGGIWSWSNAGTYSGSYTEPTTDADFFYFGNSTNGLGAGTITVTGAVTMGRTTFGSASGAIVLTGGTINLGAATTVWTNNTTNTINSVVGGAATSFTKAGTGSLNLGGNSTYTGTTAINAGTLAINGNQSAAAGAVSVSNALTRLIGTGTVGGDTTINSGAIHSAGGAIANLDKIGKQTFNATGGLTYSSGSIFEWDLNANKDTDLGNRGTDFDAVDVSGTLTVASEGITGAIFRVVLGSSVVSNAFWQQPQTWTNIFGGGFSMSGTGFNNSLLQVVNTAGVAYDQSTLNPGYGFSVSGTTLSWSAVPEPTNALAGLLITAGLLLRRRSAWRIARVNGLSPP